METGYKEKRELKKEEKRKRRMRREKQEKIKRIAIPIVAFIVIQVVLVSFALWEFWNNREMNDKNTVQLEGDIEYINFWSYAKHGVHGEITIGGKTYKFHTSKRILYRSVDSVDELRSIKNDTNITVTVAKDDNTIVGLKSDSKIYYDMNDQHNVKAYGNKIALIIMICVGEPAVIILYLFYFFGAEIISAYIELKHKKKPHGRY